MKTIVQKTKEELLGMSIKKLEAYQWNYLSEENISYTNSDYPKNKEIKNCIKCPHSSYCEDCQECSTCEDCINCINCLRCVGCKNIRNGIFCKNFTDKMDTDKYYICNTEVSKDEFEEKIKDLILEGILI